MNLGRPLFEAFPDNPTDPESSGPAQLRNSIEAAIRTRKPHSPPTFRYDIELPDGGFAEKYWSPTNIPLFSKDGQVTEVMNRVSETTDLVMIQRLTKTVGELNVELSDRDKGLRDVRKELKQTQEAQIAEKIKSEFFSTISHEMRTPLNAIVGFSQLLEDGRSNETEKKEFVRAITTAGRHLLGLINDILDLSKIDEGKLRFCVEPFDMAELLKDVTLLFEPKFAKKAIDFKIQVPPNLPKRLLGDPLRIRQIIMNLLSNASKFTKEGQVSLECRVLSQSESEATLSISVCDTGVGISDADMGQLFQRFVQVGKRNGGPGGTGLGLAITRELARMMKGDARVSSVLGKGSTFTVEITLEIPKSDSETIKGKELMKVKGEYADTPILVVDDSVINRTVVKKMLSKFGFRNISEACDGLEAIEACKGTLYSLVLMDVLMPSMGGIQATEIIRALPHYTDVPVIALSANYLSADIGSRGLFTASVSKPISIVQLQRLLECHCRIGFETDHFAASQSSSQNPEASNPEWPLKVLVVVDHGLPYTKRLLTMELEKTGDSITCCPTYDEALDLVKREPFDYVLLDRMLPRLSETVEKILKDLEKPPLLVLLSAELSSTDVENFQKMGITACLEKPLRIGQLTNVRKKAKEGKVESR